MKKIIIPLSICLITLAIFHSEARVWRLNNQTGVDADVKGTLQNAVDSVSSGDTIYVEPSPFNYGDATIAKKIIIIGPGYWLTQNDSTQAIKDSASVGQLTFNSGSQGSLISGLYFYNTANNIKFVTISTDSITIEKCFMFLNQPSYCNGNLIYINGNRTGIIIKQNWLRFSTGTNPHEAIYINGDPNNLVIKNNFISCVVANNATNYVIYATNSSSTNNFYVQNNVLSGDIQAYNSLHINNILIEGIFNNGSSGICSNNLCNGTQYPSVNSNQRNITMSNVFVNHNLNIDKGYILSVSSPAKNAGINGGDCGMFSDDYGGEPYVLSGIPDIPSIFKVNFNSTTISTNTLQVNTKAKSNK